MALRAFASAYTGLELTFVRVNSVAIVAFRKCQLLFEIPSRMAVHATHLQMSAGQRILCF